MSQRLAPDSHERANLFANLDCYMPAAVPASILPAVEFVRERGYLYLASMHLSLEPEQRAIGFLRQSLTHVRQFTPGPERRTYSRWLELSRDEALRRSREEPLDIEAVLALAAESDPTLVVIHGLERCRKDRLPEMKKIRSDYDQVLRGYDAMLTSVHGPSRVTQTPEVGVHGKEAA